ncbi:Mob1/phocein [Cubamyces sp. BRFM 1775]|nr:Mob1/phocein [Cubamyces sp. BRFM 1775]
MAVAIQRPLKGSRISSFYPVKSLPPLSALDSAFQLQEYISLLIRLDVHNVERIVSIPGKDQNENSESGAKADEKDGEKDAAGGVNVDPACWVYEHLRRVAQDLSHPLITMLQQECTRTSCPEMKAGEWLYLCVAHGNEGAMEQCCAIDYILHTLDSATALLNSPRAFPSRLSVPSTSHRHFSSLCRRLGRIFAHAYFHHREIFEQAEAESSLYARFLALVKYFDLVPLEFLVIPPRMEGRADPVEPPRLMGASLDPRKDAEPSREEGGSGTAWPGQEGSLRADRGKSPPGPAGQTRNESPRKFGRARTDTMVYSEAFSVAEELAKGDLSEVDIDREIAAERAMAAAIPQPPYIIPVNETEPSTVPEAEPEDPPRRLTAETFVPPEEVPTAEPTAPAKEETPQEPEPSSHSTEGSSSPPEEEADIIIAPPGQNPPDPEDTSDEETVVEDNTRDAPAVEEAPAMSANESSAEPSLEETDAAVETKAVEEGSVEESEAAPPAPPAAEEASSIPERPTNVHSEPEAGDEDEDEDEVEAEAPADSATAPESSSDEPAPQDSTEAAVAEPEKESSEPTETPSDVAEVAAVETEEPAAAPSEATADKTASEEEPSSESAKEPEDAASAESSS